MKVLVTGASGFIGSHVAEQLAKEGHSVRALVRKSSNRRWLEKIPGIEFAEGAVEMADRVDEAVKGVDAIVHAAGLVKALKPQEFQDINVGGTKNLVDAALKHAPNLKRFVHVSSQAAIGPSANGKPVDPNGTPNPKTHYGRSKLAAEGVVLGVKDKLPLTIVRPPAVYGPRDNETFILFKAVWGGTMMDTGLELISLGYVTDVSDCCVKAIFKDVPSGSAYFCDDGKPCTFDQLISGMENGLGRKIKKRQKISKSTMSKIAWVLEQIAKIKGKPEMLTRDKLNETFEKQWVCDSMDTRAALGWTPKVSWEEGAKITGKWYIENGWLK